MNIRLSKAAFYILSFSWGIIYTLAGLFMALIMLITGHKPYKWGWCIYFEAGKKAWGGADWGMVFIEDRFAPDSIKNHEFGHAIQNCVFGPFMLIVVCLPSTLRYWGRRLQTKRGRMPKKEYDAIWFERQATKLGTEAMERIREKNV